ncbi:MAG: sigma-70 family RNA polymerase sigma factor [Candidatus Omnitrophica bacterium]|nr:sigma-70 family RNA polymerase sigma factor [Candidatus Omnitrophota bacterium]
MEAIKTYLRDIHDIPLLTAKQEAAVAKEVLRGNKEARRKLIRSNLRLVISMAKRYAHFGLPLIDLIEEGNVGLMRAVDKFDYRKGFRFSTYAAWWIKQAITRAIFEQSRTIRIPVYMNELIAKWKRTQEALRQKLKRNPSQEEVAKKMKLHVDKVNDIENWITKMSSLEAPIGEADESQVMDLIEDTTSTSKQGLKQALDHDDIENLLHITNRREKEVLDLRFGLRDGKIHTLAMIARKLKVSRERVRQIEAQAIKKIRRFTSEEEKTNEETGSR